MQVVDADDLVRVPDFIRHGSQVDVGRCSLQEEVHGFADDPPGSPGDEGSDAEGEDGVDVEPTGQQYHRTGDHNSHRSADINGDVQKRRANVQAIVFATKYEDTVRVNLAVM